MAKKAYVGVNNVARKVSKAYVGVNGVARKVKKIYVGDSNNVAREVYSSGVKIVTWAQGTLQEIKDMTDAAYRGEINLSDYWSVGDTRRVTLPALAATPYGSSSISVRAMDAQPIDLVILGFDKNILTTPINGNTTAKVTVGLKDSVYYAAEMNRTSDNNGGFPSMDLCAIWLENTFAPAITDSSCMGNQLFKYLEIDSGIGHHSTTKQTTTQKFTFASEYELTARISRANIYEGSGQFNYYVIAANRIKKAGARSGDSVYYYWTRSASYEYNNGFVIMGLNGTVYGGDVDVTAAKECMSPYGAI